MKPKFLSLLLLVLVAHFSLAQSNESNEKVLSLIQQSNQIPNPNEAKGLILEALALQSEVEDSVRSVLFAEAGIIYGKLYINDSAKYYFGELINLCQNSNRSILLMRGYNGLGNVARTEGNNDAAMENFMKGVEIATQNEGDVFRNWESMLYGALAGIYYDLGDFEKTLEVMSKSLEQGLVAGNKMTIATNYTRLGYVYSALRDTDNAIENTLKAQPYLKELQDTMALIYNYYSLGSTYMITEQTGKAKETFQSALDLSGKYGEMETHISSMIQLGKIELENGSITKARNFGDRALAIATSEKIPIKARDAIELLSETAVANGNYRQALSLKNQFFDLKDSIDNVEVQNRINEINTKYETEKKEREIALLSAENQLAQAELNEKRIFQTYLTVLVFIILAVSVFVYFTQRQKNKLRQQALSGEISEMRIQIKELLGKYEGQLDMDIDGLNEKLVNPLSEREFDIFRHIFTQKSNQEIADELFVSINTVKTHLKNIYGKLGVSNRKEALEVILKDA